MSFIYFFLSEGRKRREVSHPQTFHLVLQGTDEFLFVLIGFNLLFYRLNMIETNSVYDATSQGSRCQMFVVGCLKRAAA